MCAEGTGCHCHSSVRASSYLCMRMPRADLGTLLPVPSGGGKLSALLSSAGLCTRSWPPCRWRPDWKVRESRRQCSAPVACSWGASAAEEEEGAKAARTQWTVVKSELQKSIGDGEDQSVEAQARKGPEDFRSSERKSAAAAAAEQLKTQVSASALNTNKLHLR